MRRKKLLSALLAVSLVLSGCGLGGDSEECPYDEFITVDVFDGSANFQGIQSGWFAKVVKDKFNMELNIIAPNVAGGGLTLYETRVAGGDVGDLVIFDASDGRFEELVTGGLLYDMKNALKGKDIMQYETGIRALNDTVSETGIYAIPSELSGNHPLTPSESVEPTYGIYLRYDLYAALGYPELETLEDLLPLLQEMHNLEPYGDTGNPTYGFSFFRDWDGNMITAAKQPACLYGYDEVGFALARADGSDYQDIMDVHSLYIRALKLYFDANQLGIMDPDSLTQNYDAVFQKSANGDVLFGFWPWLAQTSYNTLGHREEGKGYVFVPIKDLEIFSYGCRIYGNSQGVMGIGSNAQDPERLVDFIDWLYSPEGIAINNAQDSAGTAGPEGLTWERTADGPVLTEFGIQALLGSDVLMPEGWGGGTWADGISQLNYKAVVQSDLDPDGFPYAYQMWDSVREIESTDLEKEWQERMGAETTMDYLIENDMLVVAPGCDYVRPVESLEMSTIRTQCRSVINEYSWAMVFADGEEQFWKLYSQMKITVLSLGYEDVIALDMQNAIDQNAARNDIIEKYGSQ